MLMALLVTSVKNLISVHRITIKACCPTTHNHKGKSKPSDWTWVYKLLWDNNNQLQRNNAKTGSTLSMLLYFDNTHSRHVASSTIRLENAPRVHDSSDAVDDDNDVDNGFC